MEFSAIPEHFFTFFVVVFMLIKFYKGAFPIQHLLVKKPKLQMFRLACSEHKTAVKDQRRQKKLQICFSVG